MRLEELAEISKRPGAPDLDHENLSQVVNVEANLSGRDLGSVIRDIRRALGNIHLPPGVTLQLAGQQERPSTDGYESQQQAFRELLLIIIFGTVLAVSGVFLMLLITGIPLDISAFMGMIMIVGVVVNNGILLIDYAEKYMPQAKSVSEALLMASRVRLRPIMMTTLSTIFGFLPLAMAVGEGAKMLQPLAVSMIGGMSVSMPLSLLLIPTLYYLVNR